MKKYILFILISVLLAGCMVADPDSPYEVEKYNMLFTVDPVNGTVFDGTHIYEYEINGNTTTITYPNGATYWWTQDGTHGTGGWDNGYSHVGFPYVSGSTLVSVLDGEQPDNKPSKNFLVTLLLGAVGIWYTVSPYSAWYMSYGWRYKDAEPSTAALVMGRVSGVLLLILSVMLLLT